MYLEQRLEIEDRERERKFLESLGPVGRLFENNLYFCIVFFILIFAGFNIGFLIGMML